MKGLSVAISAASIAWRSRFLPVLFHAFAVIATILIQLKEYRAAYNMMDSIMPQVLECEDASLTARCFASLADSQIGLAGTRKGVWRNECLHQALNFIDRAFTAYSYIQDVHSQKLMISRKIRLQDYLEDKALRDDAVKMYRQVEKGSSGVLLHPGASRQLYRRQ